MINIHDNEGKLVMHVDPINGVYVGSAFEPRHMLRNVKGITTKPTEREVEIYQMLHPESLQGLEPLFSSLKHEPISKGGEIIGSLGLMPSEIFDGTQHWEGYNLMLGELD